MSNLYWLVSAVLFFSTLAEDYNDNAFPDDFIFGVATASYQIEGGWDADGKGENIWDRFVHDEPSRVANKDNGDVACDSYNKYEEDVKLLKDLGVTHYRFSLSWARIFPNGFTNEVNQAGIDYYTKLIKLLKDNKIEPLVTTYHWDLPQVLQDAGGWTSELMVDWYAEYARQCFTLFGDSVKYWMTFNEPIATCMLGYGGGGLGFNGMAPGINSGGIGEYLCAHNLLKAHAKAWHIYNETFRAKQKGKVGIVIPSHWVQPETDSAEDATAAETELHFLFGWYANPLLNGDYPAIMKSNIARRSKVQGFAKSRLPEFTKDEIQYLKGTVDILGVNVYTAQVAKHTDDIDVTTMSWTADAEVELYQPADWPGSASAWLKVTPWAIRNLTNWVKNTYNNPQIIITENGISDNGTTLQDDARINYLKSYLSNLRDAMEQDKVDVKGYVTWSLMDNFEWLSGYTEKFGLYQVDFSSPNRTRTPKASVEYYKKVIKTKCIVDKCH